MTFNNWQHSEINWTSVCAYAIRSSKRDALRSLVQWHGRVDFCQPMIACERLFRSYAWGVIRRSSQREWLVLFAHHNVWLSDYITLITMCGVSDYITLMHNVWREWLLRSSQCVAWVTILQLITMCGVSDIMLITMCGVSDSLRSSQCVAWVTILRSSQCVAWVTITLITMCGVS